MNENNNSKEKTNKNSIIIIAIIILVIVSCIITYNIFKKKNNSHANEQEVKKTTNEENSQEILEDKNYLVYVVEFENITQNKLTSDFSIYPHDIYCKIDENGYMNDECSPETLKNKKIIDVAYVTLKSFSRVYVLTEEGIIYSFENLDNIVNVTDEYNIKEKVLDIGYVITFSCQNIEAFAYTTNSGTYVINESNKIINKDDYVMSYSPCTCTEVNTELRNIKIYYNGTMALDKKFIYDKDTNEKISIDYSALEVKDGVEKLYLVGKNNKLYILDKFSEKVKAYDNIENVYTNIYTLYIELANGEKLKFVSKDF